MARGPKSERSVWSPTGTGMDPWQVARTLSGPLLKLAAPVALLALGYLLYGVFSGALNALAGSAAEPRLVMAIGFAGKALLVGSAVGALCLMLLTFEEIAYAIVVGIYGAALAIGTPFLIAMNLRFPTSATASELNHWGTLAGKVVITLVGLRLIYAGVAYLREGPFRGLEKGGPAPPAQAPSRPRRRLRDLASVVRPCWETPFCHGVIRDICPAYRQRRSCWRYGSGCYCDPGLVERLVASTAGPSSSTQRGYIREELAAERAARPRKRSLVCARCSIYAEHQRQKFAIVNIAALVAMVVAMALLYGPLQQLYSGFIAAVAGIAATFSYGPTIRPEQWFQQLDTPGVRVFFLVMVFLLLLTYVLRLVEWAILVKKW